MEENPLVNESYCYHGIGGDIFRLLPILEHGILSQQHLTNVNMPENSANGFGFNGKDKISVIISPHFANGPDTLGGGYSNGITFVCQTPYTKDFKSGIPFEGHAHGKIDRKNIEGIILPDALYRTPIKEYNNFLCGHCKLPEVCEKFTEFMKKECNYEASNYLNELKFIKIMKDPLDRDKHMKNLGKLVFGDLQKAIDKKLGKTNSSFSDIVNHSIKDTNLKLYNREELQKDVQRPKINLNQKFSNFGSQQFEF